MVNSSPTQFPENGKPMFSWDEAALQITRSGATWGQSSVGQPLVVTYAFRGTAPATMPSDTAGFQRFTTAQIEAAEASLQAWSQVANIQFVRVGEGTTGPLAFSNSAAILFANYTTGEEGAAAFAFTPQTGDQSSNSLQGDIWVNISQVENQTPTVGSYGLQTLMHEIGHAIGLSHPSNYNAAAGVTITYETNAEYFNDSRVFTVMTYFGSPPVGGNLPTFASTPQLHDIAAVQLLYGENATTRTRDTVYGFNSTADRPEFSLTSATSGAAFSIWDGGGNDTLDLSGYSQNAIIDLRQEGFSSAGPGSNGGLGHFNISIARGVNIENAVGGAGNDGLIGNALGNTMSGGAGADNLDGGDGNDVLFGGAGIDTLIGGLGDDMLIGGDNTDFIVDLSGVISIDGGIGNEQITVGAAVVSGTVNGGPDTDQLTKGGSIVGLTLISIEILNTNGGIVTGSAAQFESFDTVRFSAGQPTTAISLVLSQAGTLDLTDELLGRRVIFTGTAGNDIITTSNGSDNVDGGDGDDVLTGGLGVDTLIGGLGNDTLNGGDGGDFIVDLAGVMAIDAGDGDDVMTVGAAVSSGVIAGGLGVDQLNKGGAINGITISGIEIVNTNGGTLLATAAQLESFDTIRFSAALPTTRVNLALAAGTVDLTDELLGGRALITGSSGDDVITTSNGADTLLGGDGNDTLNGGAGADAVYGALGDDLVIQGSADGRDFIDGGGGTDTYQLNGTAAAETYRIMTRAEAVLAGITGLAAATEIVITRDGTDTASVIAELDNVEEISINTLLTTANNGNGTVDGGIAAGDTIIVLGDFTTTSLAYSTIHIAGSNANDTVDISGLTSAHRVVFDANGGSDAFVGEVRPQDVVTGIPGISIHTLNASAESDFDLLELMATNTAYASGNDAILAHTELNLMPADMGTPGSPEGLQHDPLSGVRPDTHQITADYAHFAI